MRFDITVHEVSPVHVRGVVTGMPKAQGVALTLNRRNVPIPGATRAAKISPDGKFDVAGVSPGAYVLSTDYFEAGARCMPGCPSKLETPTSTMWPCISILALRSRAKCVLNRKREIRLLRKWSSLCGRRNR